MVKPNTAKKPSAPIAIARAPKAPAEKPSGKREKKDKLSLRDRMTSLFTKQEARLLRFAKVLAAWGVADAKAASAFLADAAEGVHAAMGEVAKLPADFSRRAGRGARNLSVGAVVMISEKRRAFYEGAIEADDMMHLEIVKIVNNGKSALVLTADGTRTIVPTAHLRNASSADAEDEAAE